MQSANLRFQATLRGVLEDPLRSPPPHRAAAYPQGHRTPPSVLRTLVRRAQQRPRRPPYLAPVGVLVDVRSGHPGDDQAHTHDGEARENLEPHLGTANSLQTATGSSKVTGFYRTSGSTQEGAVPCRAQEEATAAAEAQKGLAFLCPRALPRCGVSLRQRRARSGPVRGGCSRAW